MLACKNSRCFGSLHIMTTMKLPEAVSPWWFPAYCLALRPDLPVEMLVQYGWDGRATCQEQRGASDSAKLLGKHILTEETTQQSKFLQHTA